MTEDGFIYSEEEYRVPESATPIPPYVLSTDPLWYTETDKGYYHVSGRDRSIVEFKVEPRLEYRTSPSGRREVARVTGLDVKLKRGSSYGEPYLDSLIRIEKALKSAYEASYPNYAEEALKAANSQKEAIPMKKEKSPVKDTSKRAFSKFLEGAEMGAIGSMNRQAVEVMISTLGDEAPEALKTPQAKKLLEVGGPLMLAFGLEYMGDRLSPEKLEFLHKRVDFAMQDAGRDAAGQVFSSLPMLFDKLFDIYMTGFEETDELEEQAHHETVDFSDEAAKTPEKVSG